jgi:hypothetical protein
MHVPKKAANINVINAILYYIRVIPKSPPNFHFWYYYMMSCHNFLFILDLILLMEIFPPKFLTQPNATYGIIVHINIFSGVWYG